MGTIPHGVHRYHFAVAVLQGGGGGAYATQNCPAGAMHARAVLTCNLYGTASKPYVDQEMDIRTFCVTQDREKRTDSA